MKIYRGEDSVKKFMEQMLKEVEYCRKIISSKFKKLLVMSGRMNRCLRLQKGHICGQKYINAEVRVRDRCDITGKYRGSAHQDCNVKLRVSAETFKLPVIFHNLRGYDSHFIMQEIGAVGENNNLEINGIPNNMEKYMNFMLDNYLVFLDSFQFMASGLERLEANLPEDKFVYTSRAFKGEN